MWQSISAFVVGFLVGVALPRIVLATRNLCMAFGIPLRLSVFLSLLAADGAAIVGGALVAWVAEELEAWIAGGSVLSGLAATAAAHRNRNRPESESDRLIRAYSVGLAPPFVLFSVLGTALVVP